MLNSITKRVIWVWPSVYGGSEARMPLPVQYVVIFVRPHSHAGFEVSVIKTYERAENSTIMVLKILKAAGLV